METITSRTNRWIKLAEQLKTKKYRDRNKMFLMEGLRSVEDALRQKKRDAICFVTDRALAETRMQRVIDESRDLHWLLLRIEEPMMRRLAGTEHNQGILAVLYKEEKKFADVPIPLHGRYVLLDGVQDPGNLGTILRTSAAAGCKGVILMEGCADPYSEKAVRSSMGSVLRIPVYENVQVDTIRAFKETCGIPFVGTALEGADPYKEVGIFSDALFVFGNEGNGITKDILELCDRKIYIPMAGTVESLNVSACAAILLFHYYGMDHGI